jgi:hypothetical protein
MWMFLLSCIESLDSCEVLSPINFQLNIKILTFYLALVSVLF